MSTVLWHPLGPVRGLCAACGADGALTLGESRLHRTLRERVRGGYATAPVRLLTCGACGSRWDAAQPPASVVIPRQR